jgi:hypothetical protein
MHGTSWQYHSMAITWRGMVWHGIARHCDSAALISTYTRMPAPYRSLFTCNSPMGQIWVPETAVTTIPGMGAKPHSPCSVPSRQDENAFHTAIPTTTGAFCAPPCAHTGTTAAPAAPERAMLVQLGALRATDFFAWLAEPACTQVQILLSSLKKK